MVPGLNYNSTGTLGTYLVPTQQRELLTHNDKILQNFYNWISYVLTSYFLLVTVLVTRCVILSWKTEKTGSLQFKNWKYGTTVHKKQFVLQFCLNNFLLPPYWEIRSDPKSDPDTDPKIPEKSDPLL